MLTFEELQKQVEDLKENFYKGEFSNLSVFDKKVQFKGGNILYTLTGVPTYAAQEGETVLFDGGGTYYIYSYLNGGWRLLNSGSAVDLSPYELIANKDSTTTLGTSDTKYPTQNAVKTYVDNSIPTTKQHAVGAITDLSTTVGGSTNEVTVYLGWRPTHIKLYYWVQGHSASGGTAQFLAKKGIAVITNTDPVFDYVEYNTPDVAGQGLSGDDGKPQSAESAWVNDVNVADLIKAGTSGAAGETYTYVYVSNINGTSFTLHRDIGSIDNPCNRGRAKLAYEAWN